MTAEPVTVSPTYPVSAAVMLMAEYRIHHLVVVDGARVVGMIDVEDLRQGAPTAGSEFERVY